MLHTVLKNYRSAYGVTQEQLAGDLYIDVRTLRRWENQEIVLKDKEELRRIASLLGVPSEILGIVTETINATQAHQTIDHVWELISLGRATEARNVAERLVTDLQGKASKDDLPVLTLAHHAKAYSRSWNTRLGQIQLPLESYHNMEEMARAINDNTLRAIALTYVGDMHTRMGELAKAIVYLDEAVHLSNDPAVKGNAIQLLARPYLKMGNHAEFDTHMQQAEELSFQIGDNPLKVLTRGQYCTIAVYEEYAKAYANQGKMEELSAYIDKAYTLGAAGTQWEMVLRTTRVIALVKSGNVQAGIELALPCIKECRATGRLKILERMYPVARHLQTLKNNIGRSEDILREALDGPIEI